MFRVLCSLALVAIVAADGWWFGGGFTERIGVFNTTGTYYPIGTVNDGAVLTIASSLNDCNLYYGGSFTGVAEQYDGLVTAEMDTAGAVTPGPVQTMEYAGASLFVGGTINNAGGITLANMHLVKYNGDTFSAIGNGATAGGGITDIYPGGDRVYVAGAFTTKNGVANTNGAAAYNTVDQVIVSLGTGSVPANYPFQSSPTTTVSEFAGRVFYGCAQCSVEDSGTTASLWSNNGASTWVDYTLTTPTSVVASAVGDDFLVVVGNFGTCGIAIVYSDFTVTQADSTACSGASLSAGDLLTVEWNNGNNFVAAGTTGSLVHIEVTGTTTPTISTRSEALTGSPSPINALHYAAEDVGTAAACSAGPLEGASISPSMVIVSIAALFVAAVALF